MVNDGLVNHRFMILLSQPSGVIRYVSAITVSELLICPVHGTRFDEFFLRGAFILPSRVNKGIRPHYQPTSHGAPSPA